MSLHRHFLSVDTSNFLTALNPNSKAAQLHFILGIHAIYSCGNALVTKKP